MSVDRGQLVVLALAVGLPVVLILLACLTPVGDWLVGSEGNHR